MPTRITAASHQDSLSGSPEKRLDIAPDGTLWLAAADLGKIRFFSSSDGGSTWAVSGASDLTYGSGQGTAVPSFYIDADGYAHISWVNWQVSPQVVMYARGTPLSGGGWSWRKLTISPAGGRTGVDSDLVAFRSGTGWVAWVSWDLSGNGGAKVSRIDVSASGALSVSATVHGPPTQSSTPYQFGSLDFAHSGDGKTPAASPHLFFIAGHQAASSQVWAHRAKWESGGWTWETPVALAATAQLEDTVLCSVHDGTRIIAAWTPNNSSVLVSEWDGVAAPVTRNPPAMPGGTGTVNGISLSCDPATGDVYLVAYGATNGNVIKTVFTRGTTTWSAWSTLATRSANTQDGDVQLVRHPTRDSVDLVFATGNEPSIELWHVQAGSLVRAPEPPRLTSPAHGAQRDLASGATFRWEYVPNSPGDTQQAWQLRRSYGGGPTVEYWNASTQAWGGTGTWNPTDLAIPQEASFPSGKWTTGTTYAWSVRTRSATGADSAWAADRTVTASLAPTVAVTAPVGIVYGTSTPTVTWTYSSPLAQRDYEIRVVEDVGLAIDPEDPSPSEWSSGVVTSAVARSHRVGTALGLDGSYRAYVRATDTNGVPSAWTYAPFGLSLLPPPGPSLSTTDVLIYETGVLRTELRLTGRGNYLSVDQAVGTSDWITDTNATVAAVTEDMLTQRLAGFSITSAASGLTAARTAIGSPPEAPLGQPALSGPLSFPVFAGQDYTAMASLKAAGVTPRAGRVAIRWYDADDGTGALISTSTGLQEAVTDAGYVQAFVTATAPIGATLARVVVEVLGPTAAGEIFYASKCSFAPGRDTTWRPGGTAQTQTIRIERSDDEGLTWTEIVARAKPDFQQRTVLTDRLMPLGVPVHYRAYADVDLGDGSLLSSEVSPEAVIVVPADLWTLRDPAEDTAEVVASVVKRSHRDDDGASVHWPAGRTYPVVDTEGNVRSGSGSLQLYVRRSDLASTLDVIRRAVPMVVQSPIGEVFEARFTGRDYETQWLSDRTITIDYVVTAGGD